MAKPKWHDVGLVKDLKKHNLVEIKINDTKIALSYKKGQFAAVSGECNHVGGPIGKGKLKGDYVVCPWHGWTYHRKTGRGQPGYEKACLPRHEVKIEHGHLFINPRASNRRSFEFHPPHPLSRRISRAKGPIRVVGISTTAMEKVNPRYSTSEDILRTALNEAGRLGTQTRLIQINKLRFNQCGGFYSQDEHACTWPCSYTQMDPKDQLDKVYEALVFWADVVIIATPIRWGNASSLYYKMAERLNCIENQMLIEDNVLLKNKVAAFIITGGQDNIQSVAGQMLSYFGCLGFHFPQFPYVGISRGWYAEDMENNREYVKHNSLLRKDTRELVERSIKRARELLNK